MQVVTISYENKGQYCLTSLLCYLVACMLLKSKLLIFPSMIVNFIFHYQIASFMLEDLVLKQNLQVFFPVKCPFTFVNLGGQDSSGIINKPSVGKFQANKCLIFNLLCGNALAHRCLHSTLLHMFLLCNFSILMVFYPFCNWCIHV